MCPLPSTLPWTWPSTRTMAPAMPPPPAMSRTRPVMLCLPRAPRTCPPLPALPWTHPLVVPPRLTPWSPQRHSCPPPTHRQPAPGAFAGGGSFSEQAIGESHVLRRCKGHGGQFTTKIRYDKRMIKTLDSLIRRCFGAGLPDPGCSSSARCRFEPSLGSEGSDESERPPLADSGGVAEGSDGAGRPIFAGPGAAVEGLDKARRPDSTGPFILRANL